MTEQPLIIDARLPIWDVEIARHLLVDADPQTTWQAARNLDLLTVHTPLLDAAMWVRGLPARLARRPVPVPAKLTLAGGDGLPGWLTLGERPGREIAVGAVGKFWQPDIEWRDVSLEGFTGFAEPGWGKIAAAFTTVPYGEGRTILTYVCRTATTDVVSRRRFSRYWWLIRPFVAHIMRATLRAVARDAERAAMRPAAPFATQDQGPKAGVTARP